MISITLLLLTRATRFSWILKSTSVLLFPRPLDLALRATIACLWPNNTLPTKVLVVALSETTKATCLPMPRLSAAHHRTTDSEAATAVQDLTQRWVTINLQDTSPTPLGNLSEATKG